VARHKQDGVKRKVLEWKVIRISYTSIYLWIFLGMVVAGAFLVYQNRDKLPSAELGLTGLVKNLMSRVGFPAGEDGRPGDNVGEIIEKRYATLSYLDGDVRFQRAMELNWEEARPNLRLSTGDRVRTFGGARAEVLFDDGSVLKIKPDSLIIIGDLTENLRTKVRRSSVRLMVSNIEADIKKGVVGDSRFRLEMPSAVAEVDRARLSVEVGPGEDSKIKVYSGEVAVDTGQKRLALKNLTQVSVGPSREISEVARLIPAPEVLSPKGLSKFYSNQPEKVAIAFRWKTVPQAKGYRFQIDRDRRFTEPILDQGNIQASGYRVTGLPSGVYYARVSALDDSGVGGQFSDPLAFMIVMDAAAPEVEIHKFVSLKAAGGYDVYLEGVTEPLTEIKLAGRSVAVDEQGHFSASLRGLSRQMTEIILTAKDHVGNENTISLEIVSRG
jgi:hypothetical protein